MRKIFTNAGFGAPGSIDNTAGSMIAVLQACLVDGYGDQTPTSITRVGTTATMVLPNAHDFTRTGVLNISGCDQADYNGEFRVTVVNSTTVTFTVANSPVTPATGASIVCRQDAAGWTMPFTGVNLAAFKQGAASNGLYLDVDDTVTTRSTVRGYETMSSVGVGTSQFPTVGQKSLSYWLKGIVSSDWVVVADESFVMVWTPEAATAYSGAGAWFFGDYREAGGINNYGTLLCSTESATAASSHLGSLDSSSDATPTRWIARDYTEVGGSRSVCIVGNYSMSRSTISASGGGSDYPDPLTGNAYMQELAVVGAGLTDNLLGYVDGAFSMLHYLPFGNSAISYFTGSGDFLNDEFVYLPCYSNGALVFRISD